MISIIILTHNEQEMLPGCLESVAWADEIVVVDKRSGDKTLEIAKQAGAKIVAFEGDHFDEWRNTGMYHVTYDWILYTDPDERVTPELRKEIEQIIATKQPDHYVYQMPRKNIWWGKEFTACGASPDLVTRLFEKSRLQKWQGIIHESPKFDGPLGTCKEPLLHFSHRNLVDGLKKSFSWTAMEAELFYKAGHPPVSWWRLAKVTVFKFFEKYIGQGGYREGTEGFLESAVQAWNRLMVYEQLWEMQQKPRLEEKYQGLDKESR